MLTAGHVNFDVLMLDGLRPTNCNQLSAHLYCAPDEIRASARSARC